MRDGARSVARHAIFCSPGSAALFFQLSAALPPGRSIEHLRRTILVQLQARERLQPALQALGRVLHGSRDVPQLRRAFEDVAAKTPAAISVTASAASASASIASVLIIAAVIESFAPAVAPNPPAPSA